MLDLIPKSKKPSKPTGPTIQKRLSKPKATEQMARDAGIALGTIRNRLRRGWSIDRALSEPVQAQDPVWQEALRSGVKTYQGKPCEICGKTLRNTNRTKCNHKRKL